MRISDFFKIKKEEKPQYRSGTDVNVMYVNNFKKYSNVKSSDEALKNSVIYRGLSILSDSVASIPLKVYRKSSQGYWELDEKNSLYNILTRRPNQRMNIYEFLEGIIMQMYLEGNAYIYIQRSGANVKELILLYPSTTSFDIINNVYTVNDIYNNVSGQISPNNIIHIKHKSLESLIGKSVVDYAGKTLGISNACDSESLETLNNGGRFKGILSSESGVIGFGEAQDEQILDIRTNMEQEISSGKNIITMPSGVKWQPISQSSKDLMINENKQYTLSDVARFIGISLSKLYIAMGSNYQAAQNEQINFFTDTLNPLLRKLEMAFNSMLIPDSVASKYKIEFDRTTLSYYSDILQNYEKQQQLGLLTTNDIRKELNKSNVENGDNVVISTNLQYIDNPKVKASQIL